MADTIIGIADLLVAKGPNTITTLGLGSCVGLTLFDRMSQIGGLAHIMLPKAPPNVEMKHKAKYADSAFEDLLKQMVKAGANPYMLVAKLAGGAHMFSNTMDNDIMKVGQRNVEMCRRMLQVQGYKIVAEDTGGTIGRTVTLDCSTGALNIRTAWPKTEKTI